MGGDAWRSLRDSKRRVIGNEVYRGAAFTEAAPARDFRE
jgi:hypothetical protein